MRILALEFSSDRRSAALVNHGNLEGQVEATAPDAAPLQLVETLLDRAGADRDTVQAVAVGLGPGSYTGIRSAIALAQGWQLARGIRLIGIRSVDCLIAQLEAIQHTGIAHLVIDAQRNEFYAVSYELTPRGARELAPLRLASFADLAARAQAGETLAGPDATRWFAEARDLYPAAAVLGRLAAARPDPVPGENLEPVYLRETQFVKAPPRRWDHGP